MNLRMPIELIEGLKLAAVEDGISLSLLVQRILLKELVLRSRRIRGS